MWKIGIIGAGAVTRKSHLPAYKTMEEIHVKAIADIDFEKCKRVARQFKIERTYSDYREMLEKEPLDIVVINTPTPTHREIALEALRTGVHVLVEKPLASSLGEAADIAYEARRRGLKLTVVQNYRFFESVRKAYSRVSSGYLGSIVGLRGEAFSHLPIMWTRSRWHYSLKAGLLLDYAAHIIDLVAYFSDSEPVSIYAIGKDCFGNMGIYNYSSILVRFKSGMSAVITASWVTGTSSLMLELFGTGGRINLDVRNDHMEEIHGYYLPHRELESNLRKSFRIFWEVLTGRYFSKVRFTYTLIIRDLIRSIVEDREPEVSVDEALTVLKIIDAALRSMETGKPIEIC